MKSVGARRKNEKKKGGKIELMFIFGKYFLVIVYNFIHVGDLKT